MPEPTPVGASAETIALRRLRDAATAARTRPAGGHPLDPVGECAQVLVSDLYAAVQALAEVTREIAYLTGHQRPEAIAVQVAAETANWIEWATAAPEDGFGGGPGAREPWAEASVIGAQAAAERALTLLGADAPTPEAGLDAGDTPAAADRHAAGGAR